MKTNFAKVYPALATKTSGPYLSFYTSISGFAQIVFYWDIEETRQKKQPVWRLTKDPIRNMCITNFDSNTFSIKLHNTELMFKQADQGTYEITEHSRKIVESLTWLAKEIIITQSTDNVAPREQNEKKHTP